MSVCDVVGLAGTALSNVPSALRATSSRLDLGSVSLFEKGVLETNPGQARLELLPTSDAAEASFLTPRNYQAALSLLECAAKALEILYDRRDQLEAAVEDVSMRAENAVAAAQAKVLDWQNFAADLKTQVQELERRLAASQQRAELAETQLESERGRVEAAERRAGEAFDLSHGLHSKILLAFGRGSSAHKALLVAVDKAPNA